MNARQLLMLLSLAAIWGASFLFMVIATPEFGAIALIEVRVVLAALVLLPIWWWREGKQQWPNVKRHVGPIVWVGLLNSAIPFVLFAYSVLFVTGGVAAVLNSTAPIYGALVAWIWLQQRLSRSAALGLAVGVAGVAILVSGELLGLGGSGHQEAKLFGVLAAAFAPVLYGIAANITAVKLNNVSALSITTFSQVAAAVLLAPLALLYLPSEMPSNTAWWCALVLAVFCTSLAYLIYFQLISEIGSTRAITVTFLIPLFGTLWGALFIGERLSLTMMVGMGVILLGTALVTGVLRRQTVT